MLLGSAKVTIAPSARLNFPASSIASSTLETIALVECHLPTILLKAQFTNALPLADGGGLKHSPCAIPFTSLQKAISFDLHTKRPPERTCNSQMLLADMRLSVFRINAG
jgi:hypothetical protein